MMVVITNGNATTRSNLLLMTLFAAVALLAPGCGDQQAAIAERGREQAANQGAETGNGGGSAYTLPSGTVIIGSLQNTVNTGKNDEGDPVRLRVTTNERVGGVVVVPAGSTIRGVMTHVDGAGRVAGGAALTIRFTDLQLPDGRSYAISAVPLRLTGKGDAKESAIEIGGGAVAGGILGGILGGKDDIAKGAAVGAVVGTGVAVATKGDQIVLSPGQRIQVTLNAPVRVTRSGA
jgi:hypothetical protein